MREGARERDTERGEKGENREEKGEGKATREREYSLGRRRHQKREERGSGRRERAAGGGQRFHVCVGVIYSVVDGVGRWGGSGSEEKREESVDWGNAAERGEAHPQI
eukprot:scaffold119305_cov26-Tisochrysis_lutea.AAC.1